MIKVVLFALPLIASSPALAETENSATEPKAQQQICKTEKKTGSLTSSRRICRTRKEWHEMRLNARNRVDEMQRGGSNNNFICDKQPRLC